MFVRNWRMTGHSSVK